MAGTVPSDSEAVESDRNVSLDGTPFIEVVSLSKAIELFFVQFTVQTAKGN